MRCIMNSVKRLCIPRFFNTRDYSKNVCNEAKFMMKFLSKPQIYSLPTNITKAPKIKQNIRYNVPVTRRMQTLNTIFMKQISDLLGTGTINPLLVERGIELVDVQISNGFETVKVIWDCQNENIDYITETAELLNASANSLRHHLVQQHVVSKVPTIKFIQDRRSSYMREIDQRLKIADFGEDVEFTPSPVNLNQNIPAPTTFIDIKKLDTTTNDTSTDTFMLPMRHDVFGLNHNVIMSRIKSSLKKSKQTKAEHVSVATIPATAATGLSNLAEIMSQKEEQTLFQKFLTKQKLNEKTRCKKLKKQNAYFLDDDEDENESESAYDDSTEEDTEDYDDSGESFDETEDDFYDRVRSPRKNDRENID